MALDDRNTIGVQGVPDSVHLLGRHRRPLGKRGFDPFQRNEFPLSLAGNGSSDHPCFEVDHALGGVDRAVLMPPEFD